jgi:hydrogenase/urease accessory protein HupE
MRDTLGNTFTGFMIGFAMLACLIVGIAHGKELGNLKAVQEYERGFNNGWKDALYKRPVSDELEMVCVGLWTATLPEQK